jgi:serine protease Do
MPRSLPYPSARRGLGLFASIFAALLSLAHAARAAEEASLHATIRQTQRRVVKIYGAGGVRGLEAYQSGTIISPEGHILTALSYVLDSDQLTVVLDDGAHYTAEVLAMDQVAELAVLKLPLAEGESVPAFDLAEAVPAKVGDRVLALSNLYNIAGGDEPVSVLQGVVAAIAPLEARRGGFQSNFRGQVYVLDAAANNPGAAGGALVDWNGRLLGILGKELKSRATGAWLHYALPIGEIAETVERLKRGESLSDASDLPPPVDGLKLADLGIVLVPNILARTPPYIDSVFPDSPAARAGLRPDDLIVFVAAEPVASCQAVLDVVGRHERFDEVSIAVLRDGRFVEVPLLADDDLGEAEFNDAESSVEEPSDADWSDAEPSEERLNDAPDDDDSVAEPAGEDASADLPTPAELADELQAE